MTSKRGGNRQYCKQSQHGRKMAGEVSDEVLADLLLQYLENPIEINVEDANEISRDKSLKLMPLHN